jgi:methionyl-tRNA formyltransferase
LKIIFAGTPDFAAGHLQALIDAGHHICAVYTQPDRGSGRGRKLTESPVKQLAKKHNLLINQPKSLKDPEQLALLRSFEAELMVVVAYGIILPQAVLDTPLLGCINVHGSLLPRWRGAAPIQRAIEAGDAQTGVTIMQMDAGLDTGDMLYKASVAIEPSDTSSSLHDKLLVAGQKALVDALDLLAKGTLTGEPQDEKLANYAHKLTKDEAIINWQLPAAEIARKMAAFTPWPGSVTYLAGNAYKVKGRLSNTIVDNHPPGTIIDCSKRGLLVACADQALLITDLQIPGKKMTPVADLLNAYGERFQQGVLFDSSELKA